ncbi:MAG TPA: TolC family protein [Gemmataceae bacterium]|nr:TolC family protein [Gemmataceae bacterium]
MRYTALRLTRRSFLWAGGLSLALSAAGANGQEVNPKPLPSALPQPGKAELPAPQMPPAANHQEAVQRYTLGEALAVAHQNHPQLAALKASMNAAVLKQKGLNEVSRIGGFLLSDIEDRKAQSDLGIRAAMAEFEQAQHEVTYAVVRNYYTVVYAREQQKVARDFVEQLEDNLARVRKILYDKEAKGIKGITKDTEDKLKIILEAARGRLIQAETGADRARAALREAMGLEPGPKVDAADEVLPEIKASISREVVIAHAATRRGEVTLAQIGFEVTELEVKAQQSKRLSVMVGTYANGADIHARPVPYAQREPDYKPGAIGPEMPPRLIGKRSTRAATAEQYAERVAAAVRQARSLVGLEADAAYSRFDEATRKIAGFKEASAAGKQLIERQREATGGSLTKEEVLTNEVSAVQAMAAYNEALYDQIMALANLERITAGGVTVKFPGRQCR